MTIWSFKSWTEAKMIVMSIECACVVHNKQVCELHLIVWFDEKPRKRRGNPWSGLRDSLTMQDWMLAVVLCILYFVSLTRFQEAISKFRAFVFHVSYLYLGMVLDDAWVIFVSASYQCAKSQRQDIRPFEEASCVEWLQATGSASRQKEYAQAIIWIGRKWSE